MVIAYFLTPLLPGMVKGVSSMRLPADFTSMLTHSSLVYFAGFTSFLSLSLFLFLFFFPAAHVWYYLGRAKNILSRLPMACDPVRRTTKKTFLDSLKELDFIHEMSVIYSDYLIQEDGRDVSEEALKELSASRLNSVKGKAAKVTIDPVSATVQASFVFRADQMVDQRLFLWFFSAFPRLIGAIAIVLLSICLAGALLTGPEGGSLIEALRPGIVAFSLCLTSALVIGFLCRVIVSGLYHQAADVAQMIDHLFHHDGLRRDIREMLGHNTAQGGMKELEKAVSRPITALVKSIDSLSENQEKKLDDLISGTLASFTKEMEKTTGQQAAKLAKTLEDASKVTVEMKKSLEEQSKSHIKHLEDMRALIAQQETETKVGLLDKIESLISDLKGEVNKALTDKNSVLEDLHKSAKDMGTISGASGKIVEKFEKLSKELDGLLKQTHASSPAENQTLLEAVEALQKMTHR